MTIINGFVEFVSSSTSPKTLYYVECIDLDRILSNLDSIPRYYLQGGSYFSAGYYRKPDITTGAGSASLNYFLKASEVIEYLLQFPEFIKFCAINNITWFLNSSHIEKIGKGINKHYFIQLGNNESLKEFN